MKDWLVQGRQSGLLLILEVGAMRALGRVKLRVCTHFVWGVGVPDR